MDDGLSLIKRNVTAHPNHFVLSKDGDLFIHFELGIKPRQCGSVHCPNSGEMRTSNVILLSEGLQSGKSLASLEKDHGILFDLFSRIQQLNVHPWGFAL